MELSTSGNFLIPCLIALVIGQLVVKTSSPNSTWARAVVVTISFIFTLRYIFWRSFYTLNLSSNTTTVISVFILILEIFAWVMPYLKKKTSSSRGRLWGRNRENNYWIRT